MNVHRRALFAQLFVAGLVSALLRDDASAQTGETVQYTYDAQGRLTRAQYSNGAIIDYTYDAAGNRTQVVRSGGASPPPPPAGFTQTIAITGTGPVNLRALADAAGYNGAQNATVTFTLASNVTISGAGGANGSAGGIAIDSGVWPTSSFSISLSLQVSGTVRGGGGGGGAGGSGVAGTLGGAGGDAIYCRVPIAITVQSGGAVRGGGAGGRGGAGVDPDPFEDGDEVGGGGGGGGQPNGFGGEGGDGNPSSGGGGSQGTTSGGGAGGAGGAGGGQAGSVGAAYAASANGVAGGHAIRRNGHTVTVTNNGTITGAVG